MKRIFIPRDFASVYLFNLMAKAIQFLITLLIIRNLTQAHDYAQYTKFYTLSITLCGIVGQSIALVYVRYNTERMSNNISDKKNDLIGTAHLINFAIFTLLIIISLLLDWYHGTWHYLTVSFSAYFLSCISLNVSFFQSREQYRCSGTIEITKQLLLLLMLYVVCFLWKKTTYYQISVAYIVAFILTNIIGFSLILPHMSLRTLFNRQTFREIANLCKISIWMLLYNALLQMLNQVDISMLGALSSDIEVSCYGVAFKYYAIVISFLPSIKTVLRVRMSKASVVNNIYYQRTFATMWLKKTAIPVLAVFMLIGFVSKVIFPIINGAIYSGASQVFMILCICAAQSYIFAPASSLIMSVGRYKLQFFAALVALVINILSNCIFIPLMGASGAAITTTIANFVFNSMLMVFVYQ